jgi:hypothetical protein
MTRVGFVLTVVLGLASILAPIPVAAQSDSSGVTGAGEAVFPSGATFSGVPLDGLTLGQGVVIASDGTATGQFQAVLLGTSLLGAPQDVVVEGEVRAGSVAGDGSATFSGTAAVDMGDGTLPLPGVPFTVTASMAGLTLILDATPLPTATLAAGSITIE